MRLYKIVCNKTGKFVSDDRNGFLEFNDKGKLFKRKPSRSSYKYSGNRHKTLSVVTYELKEVSIEGL